MEDILQDDDDFGVMEDEDDERLTMEGQIKFPKEPLPIQNEEDDDIAVDPGLMELQNQQQE